MSEQPAIARPFGRQIDDLWLEAGQGVSDPHDPPRWPKEKCLLPAEWKLLDCAANGYACEIGTSRPTRQLPETTIRASLLRFIALGGDDRNPLHEYGIVVTGAWVECEDHALDFRGALIPQNVHLMRCTVDDDIILEDATAQTLKLSGTRVTSIRASRLRLGGSLLLRNGFSASGMVRLWGAKIGGALDCSNAHFENRETCLDADGLETSSSIYLCNGLVANGEVRFLGAKTGGNLDCNGSRFLGIDVALNLDRFTSTGHVTLSDGFHAAGTVRLQSARIGSDFRATDAIFADEETALHAQGMTVEGTCICNTGFVANGLVNFTRATIKADLSCTGAEFASQNQAFHAPRLAVGGNVNFGLSRQNGDVPTRFFGNMSLSGARIEGDMIFSKAEFDGNCEVNLKNARIGGQLYWRQIAMHADTDASSATTEEAVDASDDSGDQEDKKYAVSHLNLAGASCLTLSMDWDSWDQVGQIKLDHFVYEGFSDLPKDRTISRWKDWLARQPKAHQGNRFRPHPYQQLAKVLDASGFEEEARAVRIERREMQRIFVRDHAVRPDKALGWFLRYLGNFWRLVQYLVVRHGYRPGLAIIWLAGIVVIGTGIYWGAAHKGVMTPTHPLIFKEAIWDGPLEELPPGRIPAACRENWVHPVGSDTLKKKCMEAVASEYSTFSPLIYSIDVAIPVVNFRMENDWSPRVVDWKTGKTGVWWNPLTWQLGWYVRTWEWIQIGLGWALSLLFVSAIGGVVRKD